MSWRGAFSPTLLRKQNRPNDKGVSVQLCLILRVRETFHASEETAPTMESVMGYTRLMRGARQGEARWPKPANDFAAGHQQYRGHAD